jgi:hypothetical protein
MRSSANRISCVKISHEKRELHASPKHEIAGSLAKFTGTVIAKGGYMKIIIQNLLAAIFLITFSVRTHAQGVIDQESAAGPVAVQGNGNADGLNIQEDMPLEQSFIPELSAIDFISLEFVDIPGNGTAGATVDVNLYSGSPYPQIATLLGTTLEVHMPNGFNNNGLGIAGIETFGFLTPIALTAGETYYLEPVVLSGDNPWDIITIGNTYPNGQVFEDGSGLPSDFWFQEGINAVPEPTTLALIGIGILAFIFRPRSKLPVMVFAGILFTIPVLSVKAGQDSVVQATASAAGLSSVTTSELPADGTGTYWITSVNPNGGLTTLPYPFLPTDMSELPIFTITNQIFLVDDTHGDISSSAETMSRADASSVVASESQSVESIIDLVETPPSPPTNGETDGTNGIIEPNGLTPTSDTTNIWLLATNESPDIGFTLENPTGNNYQLLSTTNLITANATNWNLGEILFGASVGYNTLFSPILYTNAMMFFRVHQAEPVMRIQNNANSTEMNATNDLGADGSFQIVEDGSQTGNVTVYYSISGTATNGVDYAYLSGSAVMSNSPNYVNINIAPFTNGIQPNQTVILTLTQNTNYLIEPASYSATNTIFANPKVYPNVNGDNEFPCPEVANTFDISANDSDPRSLPLTYTILTNPTHGTLTGTPPIVTYTPTNCYEGPDGFTYLANNGQYSSTGTVTLVITNIVSANQPTVQTCRGTETGGFSLGGDASCGIATNFALLSGPFHGVASGTAANCFYTPTNSGWTGTDTFAFEVYDSCGDFATNYATIYVGDKGIATTPENIITGTNKQVAITLNAADNAECSAGDTNYYTYAITSEPTYGTLSTVSGANVTYTPPNNFEGQDSFQYIGIDGSWSNTPATVTVNVTAGPILSQNCNPFGTNVVLDWTLDSNAAAMNLNIQDYIVYRSTNSNGPFTAIGTNDVSSADTYLDTNAVTDATYYYAVAFQSADSPSGFIVESPRSNEIGASTQNPDNFISANSFWQVVVNTNFPNIVTNLQAPFSSFYPTNSYFGLYPWPNSFWAVGTTMSNYTTMVIPTNTDLSQVQYAIAIDNDYLLYLNNSNAPIETFSHQGNAAWASFKSFDSVAPGLLHYGTNSVRLEIIDDGVYNYFSMVVTTNTCGM